MAWWHSGKALDLRSTGHRFDARPGQVVLPCPSLTTEGAWISLGRVAKSLVSPLTPVPPDRKTSTAILVPSATSTLYHYLNSDWIVKPQDVAYLTKYVSKFISHQKMHINTLCTHPTLNLTRPSTERNSV